MTRTEEQIERELAYATAIIASPDRREEKRQVLRRLCAEYLLTAPPGPPSITCPRCGRTSYNTNDIREGYCGACHQWTSPMPSRHWERRSERVAVAPLDGFERGLLEEAVPALRAEYRHAFADVLQAILERFTAPTVSDATDVDALLIALEPFAAAGELLLIVDQLPDDLPIAELTHVPPLTVGKLRAVALALRAFREKLARKL